MDQFFGSENDEAIKRNQTTHENSLHTSKIRYPSRLVDSKEEPKNNLNPRLPSISFPLSSDENEHIEEKLKRGSKFCPNYFFISSNITSIKSFIDTHQNYIFSRRNARYALIIKDSESVEAFNSTLFLDDVKFFQKVLNLAVFLFSKSRTENAESNQIGFPITSQSSPQGSR